MTTSVTSESRGSSQSERVIVEEMKKSMKKFLSKDEMDKMVDIFSGIGGENPTKFVEITKLNKLAKSLNSSKQLGDYDTLILEYYDPKPADIVYYVENYSFE